MEEDVSPVPRSLTGSVAHAPGAMVSNWKDQLERRISRHADPQFNVSAPESSLTEHPLYTCQAQGGC